MLTPRQVLVLLHGRYFTSGLVSAVGVALFGLATYAIAGLGPAIALGSGALTVCFADNPAPTRVKRVELLFTSVASTVAFALVGASLWWPAVQIVLIPVLGFISGLIAVWGKRALAMSFSVLFISVITLGSPPLQGPVQLAAAVTLFFIGALLYTAYALLLARWLRRRTKEQALAELLAQLGQFAHWLANHFGGQSSGLSGAVAQLTAINDTLQNTRDIVLRDVRTAADRALAARLILLLEVNEALLAGQTDGDLILKQFDATPVPDALRDWAQRIGDALDQRADALLRGRPANTLPAHLPCAQTIEHALATLQPSQPSAEFEQARMALRASADKFQRISDLLAQEKPVGSPTQPDPLQGMDLQAFLSPLRYDPNALWQSIRFESPILRYAIRLALALFAGELVLRALPYHPHDYWVLLTIGVILRPNYSVTRQRIKDRVLGTLLGCILVAALLSTHPSLGVMTLGVFVSLAFARTFITLNYRFTALFASVNALLLVALLEPGTQFLVTQRLQDTLIGAALAWAFSFVLPRWEANDLRRQVDALQRAALGYAQAVLDPQQISDLNYRRERKRIQDALAAVGGLHARMLEEPRQHQRMRRELAEFIAHSDLLSAHLATLRVLRAQRGDRVLSAAEQARLRHTLALLQGCLDQDGQAVCIEAAETGAIDTPIERRLREVEAEGRTIAQLSRQILSPVAT
ncbi:MAG: FUSC family protein [Thiomonas arsenitoxydans]|uniref:FUSC family protein n=1 Tax=Thiomonas arsenitoxydans (strain DSM 22701 / CIP 110005 / 3As) TaxID=426114 RepID=A0A8I1SVZ6_THIA3|nr:MULTISPECIES: FUSC family membrane protein [Thiomonas]MBN8743091.1 FUSC family protein [Thiomonas arsenitoxydans]ODU97290.1 MAG: MFS transporter permease [Thiomonas sp. SCN 64-16]